MNDAAYIKALAHQYQWSQIPEFMAHRERLLQIAARLETSEASEAAEASETRAQFYERKRAEAYTWKLGDKLRVIRAEPGDPFEVGDIVYHQDIDGSSCPYVIKKQDDERWAMSCTELEKVK